MNKKILVTGGAGFIGSQTVKDLLKSGYEPVIIDSLITGGRENLLTDNFYEGDIGDSALLKKIFNDHAIEAVIHFSASIEAGKSVTDPATFFDNNVTKMLGLLDAMIAAGVKKIIFSSSAAVYGDPVEIPITETHPLNPTNPYGLTKKMGEEALAAYAAAHGLRAVSLRYFNASGSDPEGKLGPRYREFTHAIPLAVMAALKGGPFYIFGTDYDTPDGTAVRDYVHVVDLARAHVKALDNIERVPAGSHVIFNLGTGTGTSVRELVGAVTKLVGPLETVEGPRRAGDPSNLVASYDKAGKFLGWKPERQLDDIIKDTANFFRQTKRPTAKKVGSKRANLKV